MKFVVGDVVKFVGWYDFDTIDNTDDIQPGDVGIVVEVSRNERDAFPYEVRFYTHPTMALPLAESELEKVG